MLENTAFISLSYLILLQISLINSKSQLFKLQNNRIVLIESEQQHIVQDEIFSLISSKNGPNFWIKDSENSEFTYEVPSE
jgi:hypothetical protein